MHGWSQSESSQDGHGIGTGSCIIEHARHIDNDGITPKLQGCLAVVFVFGNTLSRLPGPRARFVIENRLDSSLNLLTERIAFD